jgi:hypothetical protein
MALYPVASCALWSLSDTVLSPWMSTAHRPVEICCRGFWMTTVRQIGGVCFAIFIVLYPVPYATAHVHIPLGIWLHFTALVPSRVAAYGNLLHTMCLCLPGSIYGRYGKCKSRTLSPPHRRK